ncbi:MAG: T9SS type A sorting domain-containing protein, partial [Bacteroidetes bacterium]|nr:T9SS type A sorting domain-containing protein [Bacteroidota bacterium]
DAAFLWDFGPDASPVTSTDQNPTGVTFSSSAERQITLTVTRFGCVASVIATVNINNPVGCQSEAHKVRVCHIPPGNPGNAHEICIDKNAVKAHLKHGDCIGSCGDLVISIDDSLLNPPQNNVKVGGIPIILAYPNPARSNITVSYTIYEPSNNTLSFYNFFGEEVIRLVDSEQQDEGSYSYSFNTSGLNSGIYFTILRADSYIVTYKTVIIK